MSIFSRDVTRSVRFGNFGKPVCPGTGSVCTFIETDSVRFYFVIKVGRFGSLNETDQSGWSGTELILANIRTM